MSNCNCVLSTVSASDGALPSFRNAVFPEEEGPGSSPSSPTPPLVVSFKPRSKLAGDVLMTDISRGCQRQKTVTTTSTEPPSRLRTLTRFPGTRQSLPAMSVVLVPSVPTTLIVRPWPPTRNCAD